MLNTVVIMGRLCSAPEIKKTSSGISVTSFTVAIDRNYKSGEEKVTDFINVAAWRGTAEFICNYFKKGQMIAVEGSIQSRNYEDKDGNKRTAFEVVASNVSFCGDKSSETKNDSLSVISGKLVTNSVPSNQDGFEEITSDGDLPF